MNRYEGKAAAVTGGASGIGLATAHRLASEGAAVAVIDHDGDGAQAAAREIVAAGGRALPLAADVTRGSDLRRAFAAAAETFGRMDIIVNSAGIIARGDLDQTTEEEWRRVIDVDLSSMFYSARAAAPLLRAAGGGSIVNIASVAGSRGAVNVAYVAAKGGVISLTRQLAAELAEDRIRVNSVSPGFTATALNRDLREAGAERLWAGRIPLGRYAQPDEIAAACAFLGSSDAAYITGIDLVVDGGMSAILRPDTVAAG